MIEISNVSRLFARAVLAVDDVSLTVGEGEFVTLLGPSGCGKTTLLRLLAGFDRPTSGGIRLAGEDVTNLPPYNRDVNMVFQDYALFPHLSVAKNVAFGLERERRPRAEIADRVKRALQMVDLADKAENAPHELSGGQRQRVALARALIRGPRVLLLDEPLSALDAGLREQMQVELKRLHEKLGITFVMVTHDQTEALVMSDRIVVMQQGRIAQVGTPDELYNAPRSTYVASFIGTTNLFDGTVETSTESELVVQTGSGRFQCASRLEFHAGQRVKVGARPEYLHPAGEMNGAGSNVLRCKVLDVLFHGNHTRFRCATQGSDDPLYWDWIQPRHTPCAERPGTGTQLTLTVAPSDMLVFPQDDRP